MIFTEKEERDGKTHFYPKIPASGAGGANGVMLDSSLSVKKTVIATGVKAPTITGGSSGGGGGTASTPKIAINGLKNPIGEIQMNVGDLKDETEAKKSLPSMVTLLVDNKEIKDVTAKIGDWKIKNGTFDGNTAGSYTFVGAVKILCLQKLNCGRRRFFVNKH